MTETISNTKTVAIQGGYGAFHEIAANAYFNENIEIVPNPTFQSLISAVETKKVDFGIIAIENSLVGSILPNYTLIKNADLKIIGETYLHIQQNFVALPGQKISDIEEVFSHPMAILQCEEYFKKQPHIKLTESDDTANSARRLKEQNIKGAGAICSLQAAKKYELEILAESIETNKQNFTRFLVITHENNEAAKVDQQAEKPNKISLCFSTLHEIGSLSKVLNLFTENKINLTKIQSLPIPGHDWEYFFYVDLAINSYDSYLKTLEELILITDKLKILGEYQSSPKTNN